MAARTPLPDSLERLSALLRDLIVSAQRLRDHINRDRLGRGASPGWSPPRLPRRQAARPASKRR